MTKVSLTKIEIDKHLLANIFSPFTVNRYENDIPRDDSCNRNHALNKLLINVGC